MPSHRILRTVSVVLLAFSLFPATLPADPPPGKGKGGSKGVDVDLGLSASVGASVSATIGAGVNVGITVGDVDRGGTDDRDPAPRRRQHCEREDDGDDRQHWEQPTAQAPRRDPGPARDAAIADLGHGVGEVVAPATAGAFRDLPRRRRGSSGGIPLPRDPAREQGDVDLDPAAQAAGSKSTSSRSAIEAASPWRGPSLTTRV